MKKKRIINAVIYHVVVCGIGLIMIYPLIWMIMSSFKPTGTIFTTFDVYYPEQARLEIYGTKGTLVVNSHGEALTFVPDNVGTARTITLSSAKLSEITDVTGTKYAVITAAHVFKSGTTTGSANESFTRLWLGEVEQ